MIVNQLSPVTLIGGGDIDDGDLDRACKIGSTVVAADGGATVAVANGLEPAAVIGDFDSLDEATRDTLQQETLHHFKDQDSTDFEKCLRNIEAPLVIGTGFAGARIDHHLANLNTLVQFPAKRCILLGSKDVTFLAPPSYSLDLMAGTPVSLFPLGAVEGVSEGLKWPIAGLNFAPDRQIGTSNEATGPITLRFTSPKMLVILPKETFETAAEALLSTPANWQPG
ncbi:MAG: thiamine diphosphokinase [Pseudomonadota bacterium]